MKKPHTLTDRECNLIAVYSQCQLGMTPRQFHVKWGVSYTISLKICYNNKESLRTFA